MGSEDAPEQLRRKRWRRFLNSVLVLPRGQRSLLILLVGLLLATFLGFLGLWTYRHLQCYSREAGIEWKPAPIIDISRPCPLPQPTYPTVAESLEKPRICLTTLTDRKSQSAFQRLLRCRNFDGVAHLTYSNLQAYAKRHGYTLFDASGMIDTSRPPAWSKILAVQQLLREKDEQNENKCDWVFWVDADIVVTNSTIAIETFLPTNDAVDDVVDSSSSPSTTTTTTIDLLITMDRRLTANSGAWLIRNTKWSQEFLQTWWGMRRWVREPGLSLSGDNAAFGHLIQEAFHQQQSQPTAITTTSTTSNAAQHIRMVPRCTFNSFAVFVPNNNNNDEIGSSEQLRNEEWYLSENFYHQGDFMAHASGVDQKEACVTMLLAKAK